MPRHEPTWTPERIKEARAMLEGAMGKGRSKAAFPPGHVERVAAELTRRWGVSITRESLYCLRRRLGEVHHREPSTIPEMAPAHPVEPEGLEAVVEREEVWGPRSKGKIHVVIPDTQVAPGTPVAHLGWIGRYLVEQFAGQDLTIIHLGDHWDMPALSSYDKGTARIEGRRYKRDIEAGNTAFALLNAPLLQAKAETGWAPAKHFLRGNHEDRITRAANLDAQLLGVISLDDLDTADWTVHPFLEPVFLDGVGYSHYWYQPLTGKPYGGMIETRLKTIGHSFTMGHQQTLLYGVRYVGGASQHGLVCGSCYTHDEDYKGPQGNSHWRGIIVKHRVSGGSYDPMFVSLNYLRDRYA